MTDKLNEFATEVVRQALLVKSSSKNCESPEKFKAVDARGNGWSIVLDAFEHPSPIDEAPVLHFHLSTKLNPPGRSSTADDWKTLGAIVRAITDATGYPSDKRLDPILPLKNIHPNSAIHWVWHGDGSDVDEATLDGLAKAISMVQQEQIDQAVRDGLAEPLPKTGRNEMCPCGSGRKFKKCHGGN